MELELGFARPPGISFLYETYKELLRKNTLTKYTLLKREQMEVPLYSECQVCLWKYPFPALQSNCSDYCSIAGLRHSLVAEGFYLSNSTDLFPRRRDMFCICGEVLHQNYLFKGLFCSPFCFEEAIKNGISTGGWTSSDSRFEPLMPHLIEIKPRQYSRFYPETYLNEHVYHPLAIKRILEKEGHTDSNRWRQLRETVLTIYGRKCMCCENTPTLARRTHVDHIKPKSKYPELQYDFYNHQVLCQSCNSRKLNRNETDYRPKSLIDSKLLKQIQDNEVLRSFIKAAFKTLIQPK